MLTLEAIEPIVHAPDEVERAEQEWLAVSAEADAHEREHRCAERSGAHLIDEVPCDVMRALWERSREASRVIWESESRVPRPALGCHGFTAPQLRRVDLQRLLYSPTVSDDVRGAAIALLNAVKETGTPLQA